MIPIRKINVMRKQVIHSVIFLAIAGWIFGACSNQPLPGAEPSDGSETVDGIVLSASLPEDNLTKTSLGTPSGGEYDVLWKTGDKISINGIQSEAVASSDNGKKVVDFSVGGSLTAPFKVLYPGTSSSNVIVLPSTQTYVANSFDGAAAASYGNATKSGDKYSVQLNSFCGILRFALCGSGTLDRIEINSLGSEKLYGSFLLATDSNGFTGSWSGGTAGTLTYDCDVSLSNSSTYFYVAIPAQAYASGLEALVYKNDGTFMRLKFWGSGKTLSKTAVVEFEPKEFAPGRTEDLFSIAELEAENGGEPTVTPPGITVATFNVMRMDSDPRSADPCTGNDSGALDRPANAIVPSCVEMHEALGKAIFNTNADLIGFQEICEGMYRSGQTYSLQDMAAAQGASYTWKLEWPASESGNYHYCNGFAYKSSVLTLNSSGKVWLRSGSNSYSSSSQSNSGDPNRTVVWALFTHKVSGKQFYFFVTQLPTHSQDGGNGTSNLNMAGGVNAFATSKTLNPNRQILVGDMNSVDYSGNSNQAGAQKLKEYWTDAYESLNAAGNLSSFYQTYSGTQSGTGYNYQYEILRFCKNHPERRLDHIMTKGNCTVQSYRTIRTTYTFGSGDAAVECAPSDHLPVVAYITLD